MGRVKKSLVIVSNCVAVDVAITTRSDDHIQGYSKVLYMLCPESQMYKTWECAKRENGL